MNQVMTRQSIPIPEGGFASNELEARWLADTLELRIHETLANFGLSNLHIEPKGLYDLLLLSLNSAAKRATRLTQERDANNG